MKRGYTGLLLLALATVSFLAANVFADDPLPWYTCDSEHQKLFGMYSLSNAHAEQWNGTGGYGYDVCYYNFFSGKYSPGDAAPHSCHDDNTILRLAMNQGLTNAHAEGPDNATSQYFNICYGDLSCFLQDPGKNCNQAPGDGTYSIIVSLSSDTNTHAAFTNASGRALCCKSAGTDSICDYDGTCDPPGETPINCPDCIVRCGNYIVEGIEECDRTNLSEKDCTNYVPDGGFVGGTLACYPPGNEEECMFDTSGCTVSECSDGVDNDGDGAFDYPNDFSCKSASDNNETEPKSECQNGDDDDDDGLIDMNDPGCTTSQDNSEANCGDGVATEGAEECDLTDFIGGNECRNHGYKSGTVTCTEACTYNFTACEGFQGFCVDNQPFEFEGEVEGAWLSPSSCQDYNKVYPDETEADQANRRELCLNDCVPGASDPVNNGYGGEALLDWGCGWDPGDSGQNNGECYFYFNSTEPGAGQCRLDYSVLSDCGPDNPFRTVEVTSTPIGGGSWTCDACGDGSSSCTTEIPCPRVVQLPFIGAIGLALAVVIIALIYAYLKRKK